ncbi:hypothetical protein SAY87_013590 [Trapa incisa]|uniref:Uncharacterized protein n=1 Tax=Trapa incisa TaxID=236973 RepID=A0AAN7KIN6_9MYRT|nr:hypothetical protein SAY87_013590 [Trapa incisa]
MGLHFLVAFYCCAFEDYRSEKTGVQVKISGMFSDVFIQTGEVYYMKWRAGMKAEEDAYYHSEEDEDNRSNYDSH